MKVFAALVCLFSSAACASDSAKTNCNFNDPTSVCEVRLTVSELNTINTAFENSEMAHVRWSPVWSDIQAQLLAQQPKAVPTPR